MLLWVVLSTAAIFSPSFSQPTRTDGVEESDYNLPLYRERSDLGEPSQRQLDAIENLSTNFKTTNPRIKLYKRAEKQAYKKLDTAARKTSSLVDTNYYYRTSGLDTIGGGNLLRRETGLDSIGGGNLLRREAELDPNNEEINIIRRGLDSIGGGNLLREAQLVDDGKNILRRDLDTIGGGNLLRRQSSGLDSIGGGNLLRRESGLDPIGNGNLLRRDVRPDSSQEDKSCQMNEYSRLLGLKIHSMELKLRSMESQIHHLIIYLKNENSSQR